MSSVAVLVATRERPELLQLLVNGLSCQSLTPAVIVIVDSSPSPQCQSPVPGEVPIVWIRTTEGSLTAQRNLGLAHLASQPTRPTYVAVLDDDVEPGPGYLEALVHRLDRFPDAVGVSATVDAQRIPASGAVDRLHRLFLLKSDRPGHVLASGINIGLHRDQVNHPIETDWLMGCSVWRWKVFESIRFMEPAPGSSLCEDVEFSVRARRYGRLVQFPEVLLGHSLAAEGRPDDRLHQRRWVRNRAMVIHAMGGGPIRWSAYWWSNVGALVLNAAIAARMIKRKNRATHLVYLRRAHGLLEGSLDTILRRPPS